LASTISHLGCGIGGSNAFYWDVSSRCQDSICLKTVSQREKNEALWTSLRIRDDSIKEHTFCFSRQRSRLAGASGINSFLFRLINLGNLKLIYSEYAFS
jgi:hypothetical protein